jgi:hypothetical protein
MTRPDDRAPLLFDVAELPYHSHDHGSHDHHHSHGPSIFARLFRRRNRGVAPLVEDDHGHEDHHHHHHHEHEDEESFRQRLNDLADELKAVDGIDETANLVGQIFPGLAAPIATLSILAIATPLVFLGIIGMKHEYEQAKEDLKDILAAQKSVQEKLQQLNELSNAQRRLLNEKLGLEIAQSETTPVRAFTESTAAADNKFLNQIYAAQMIANRRMILEISKKYGWSGVLGMSGMFAGMIPAVTSAALEIVEETASSGSSLATSMEAAAHIAHQVAGSFFLVGQVAMAAYAGSRLYAGVKGRKILEDSKASFEDFAQQFQEDEEVAKATSAVLQIFKKKQYFLNKNSIQYAKLTIAGQVFMGAGTICGLSGVGLAATVPLFAIGAPLTIYPAVNRIIGQKQNENFSGASAKNCEFVKTFSEKNSISKMLEGKALQARQQGDEDKLQKYYKDIFTETAQKLNLVNENLAELKIISLVLHLVNDKKYQGKTPERKLEILKQKLKINEESNSLKSSNLEEGVVAIAKEKFREKEGEILEILQKERVEASKILIKESLQRASNLNNLGGPARQEDLEIARQKELIHLLGIENTDKLDSASIATVNKFSRLVVNNAKAAAKVARDNLADNMVTIPCLFKMREALLQFENEQEQPAASTNLLEGNSGRERVSRLAPLRRGALTESVA